MRVVRKVSITTLAFLLISSQPAFAVPETPEYAPGINNSDKALINNEPYFDSAGLYNDPERSLSSGAALDLNNDGDTTDNYEDGTNFFGPKRQYISAVFDGGQNPASQQVSYIRTITDDYGHGQLCNSWQSCAGQLMEAHVNLVPCTQNSVDPCIEGVRVGTKANMVNGVFVREVSNVASSSWRTFMDTHDWQGTTNTYQVTGSTNGSRWSADSTRGLPAGGSPSIWNLPGVPNVANETTYLARASLNIYVAADGTISFDGLDTEIVPFKEISEANTNDFMRGGSVQNPLQVEFEPPVYADTFDGTSTSVSSQPARHQLAVYGDAFLANKNMLTCAWEEANKCGASVKFTDGTRAEITLRIPEKLGGWFHGRLSDTEMNLTSVGHGLNKVTISAESVNVPVDSAFYPLFAQNGASTSAAQTYYQNQITEYANCCGADSLAHRQAADAADRGGWAVTDYWSANQPNSLNMYLINKAELGDRAKGVHNIWKFGTLPAYETDSNCFSNKSRLQGMITTNAMVYQAGLPVYANGKFKYQVAGVHENYDGSVFKGNYDLIMRAEDAACLYGVTFRKINASVKVLDGAGGNKDFKSSVSIEGGWIGIHANDFTFSEPLVEVEFTEGDTAAAPSPSTGPAVKIAATKTFKKSGSISKSSLRYLTKTKAKFGDKITFSLDSGAASNVKLKSSYLSFKKPGTYVVKVNIKRRSGETITKYLQIVVK